MAKKFFYICAGLSLIVLALSGAMQARAQIGTIELGEIEAPLTIP